MLNEKVCLAYVNNSQDREIVAGRWSKMFDLMPIGVPMTATEIAEKATKASEWQTFDYREATQMLGAMLFLNQGYIKREEIPCDPYEIEVEHCVGWDPKSGEVVCEMKKITIDHKAMFTRLV